MKYHFFFSILIIVIIGISSCCCQNDGDITQLQAQEVLDSISGETLLGMPVSTVVNQLSNPNFIGLPTEEDSFDPIIRFFQPAPDGRNNSLDDIIIRFYTDSFDNPTSYNINDVADNLLSNPNFDVNKKTVLYIFGNLENINNSAKTVVEAYLDNALYNILVFDYANIVYGNYLSNVLALEPAGKKFAKVLLKLIDNGFPLNTLHVVGFSLGAHVAANIGKTLQEYNYLLGRISGLDPAGPLCYPPLSLTPYLINTDAKFVDVIHADKGVYGTIENPGHVNFFPNGGQRIQPGCPIVTLPFSMEAICSHNRVGQYWSESVRKEGKRFLASKCRSLLGLLSLGDCNDKAIMGLEADASYEGNYYLTTASESPFALGEDGIPT